MAINTYPPHYLLQWGGTLHTNEIWSNSLRMVQNTGSIISPSALQTFLAEFEGELATLMGSGLFHSETKATFAKCNPIGPTGKYLSETQSNSRFFAVSKPGVGIKANPPQISVAVTLLTGTERGLANRGRFFLAGLSNELFTTQLSTGLMASGAAEVARDSVTTFLNAINNNPGLDAEFGGLDVHIVSQGNLFTNGVARKVTGVKVGNVYDTQRRRRNNLTETYTVPSAVS